MTHSPTELRGFEDADPFRLLDELPEGTTVLEASAGTGKTYTIAALAARYVAQGIVSLDRMMIVTFGRAATDELRERVRERLVDTAAGLADPAAARTSSDEVLAFLADAQPAEVQLRRRRLERALATFDAATITTTHGMCQLMLAALGLAADTDPGAELAEDGGDLNEEVVSDVFMYRFAGESEAPPVSYPQVVKLAGVVSGQPDAVVTHGENASADVVATAELATSLRRSLQHRRRAYGLMDFDDLLVNLDAALAHPEVGEVARERMRARFDLVLVDEFQDTDPLQWRILRTAFHGVRRLVLVGDPKQAIYGFRGGDVETYHAATADSDARFDLAQNWRADPELLAGVTDLLGHTALGDTRIKVRPVKGRDRPARLTRVRGGADSETGDVVGEAGGDPVVPIRLRWFPRSAFGVRGTASVRVDPLRAAIPTDVVEQVRHLLNGEYRWESAEDGVRPLRPGDIAVLCRTNSNGEDVCAALQRAGVPAVMNSAVNVFTSAAAGQWRTLLAALDRIRDGARVRDAALSVFGGWTGPRLAAAGDDDVEEFRRELHRWGRLLEARGLAAMWEYMSATGGVQARALERADGERMLTDLRHLAEALHQISLEKSWSATGLLAWLDQQIRTAKSTAHSRRLESDAAAVQVVTVHRSKGLEFPVVLVPFASDEYLATKPRALEPVKTHDSGGHRRLVFGTDAEPDYTAAFKAGQEEDAAEGLRLLYVAMTRASGHLILWWAPGSNARSSALHRVLFGERDLTGMLPLSVPVPRDDALAARFSTLASSRISTEQVKTAIPWHRTPPSLPPPGVVTEGGGGAATGLELAPFDRVLDAGWRRTSYSGITAAVHAASSSASRLSEPDDAPDVDEPVGRPEDADIPVEASPTPGEAETGAGWDTVSPMAELPSGAVVGTFVHAALENADTSAEDLREELVNRAELVGAAGWASGAGLSPTDLAEALLPVMRTPLGPVVEAAGAPPTFSLHHVQPRDRLSELTFELPLAGGDDAQAGAGTTVARLAEAIASHLPPDDPLASYPERLNVSGLKEQHLRGYLTGSIDSVLRIGPTERPRYVVVDYKTNWLGQWGGQVLTAADYRQAALAEAMMHSHYPLQALLYQVALHRYLRWRQPDYDPRHHLGGVLYLFLRGMVGEQAPRENGCPSGVFGWTPPVALVEDLSDLLAGEGS